MTIPGVGRQAAEVIVAEIGADMSRSPMAGHLASWAGLCTGNNTGAERRKGGRTTKGSRWLRATPVQVAWADSHIKGSTFGATYRELARRLGKKKALVAVARRVLVLAYLSLKAHVDYQEPLQAESAP